MNLIIPTVAIFGPSYLRAIFVISKQFDIIIMSHPLFFKSSLTTVLIFIFSHITLKSDSFIFHRNYLRDAVFRKQFVMRMLVNVSVTGGNEK